MRKVYLSRSLAQKALLEGRLADNTLFWFVGGRENAMSYDPLKQLSDADRGQWHSLLRWIGMEMRVVYYTIDHHGHGLAAQVKAMNELLTRNGRQAIPLPSQGDSDSGYTAYFRKHLASIGLEVVD